MKSRILWLDNDLEYLVPYVDELQQAGHSVTTVGNLSDADDALARGSYDLLILDVMIPTRSAAEEETYPPDATSRGTATGLVYYRRWRDRLQQAGTRVLILTVRIDAPIRAAFIDAGVPKCAVARKLDLRAVEQFTLRVNQVLGVSA